MEQTRPRTTQTRPQNVRPRRKKRRAPIKELAICAGVIFLVGFILGFLVRGAFLPKQEPNESAQLPAATTTEPKAQPPVPLDDWRLVLVNKANPLPEEHMVSMTQLPDGYQVDKRCYSDLQAMLDACAAAGLYPRLESAYRDWAAQNERLDQEIAKLVEGGMNHAQAEKEAAKTVANAGCSEHHLGLAVDIADSDAQKWLQEHSWEYGFILRYPGDKTAETGYAYNPGHYRYVGREVAAEMWEKGLCLEEYIQQYQ